MIQVTITYYCRTCGSDNIIRNGANKCGNPQYHCKGCGAYGVLDPKRKYAASEKETILRACRERSSMRGGGKRHHPLSKKLPITNPNITHIKAT